MYLCTHPSERICGLGVVYIYEKRVQWQVDVNDSEGEKRCNKTAVATQSSLIPWRG